MYTKDTCRVGLAEVILRSVVALCKISDANDSIVIFTVVIKQCVKIHEPLVSFGAPAKNVKFKHFKRPPPYSYASSTGNFFRVLVVFPIKVGLGVI